MASDLSPNAQFMNPLLQMRFNSLDVFPHWFLRTDSLSQQSPQLNTHRLTSWLDCPFYSCFPHSNPALCCRVSLSLAFWHILLLLHPSSDTSSLASGISHLTLLSRPFTTYCRSLIRSCFIAGPLQWSLSLTIVFPRKHLSSSWVLNSPLDLPVNTCKSTSLFCSHSSCSPGWWAWFPFPSRVFHPHFLHT